MSTTFKNLKKVAEDTSKLAYAPYSNFHVGASIRTKSGEVYGGCNVENGSYSLGLCAERNAITTAVANGHKPGDIVELVLYIGRDELFSPCGACRQVISEFMPADAKVTACNALGDTKEWTVAELLPDGFQLPE